MIAYVDASAGVSGDMLLGAIVDLGVGIEVLQAGLDHLGLPIQLSHREVSRGGMRASKVDVQVPDTTHHRHLGDVLEILGSMPSPARERARAVFTRLAEAEGRVHGIDPTQVHFHEVGALDAIADIAGIAVGLEALGIDELHCSAIGLGSGRVDTEHGSIPVPVPAVVELLKGSPAQAGPAPFESATPTGVAVLTSTAAGWGAMPAMSITDVGVGAGSGNPTGWPNVVRIVLGERIGGTPKQALQLESNVDDMDPRLWPEVQRRLLLAGASDAWLTSILMKKGRPAHTLSVLCSSEHLEAVRDTIYAETTTIGIRIQEIGKHVLARQQQCVEIQGQQISVKVARLGDEVLNVSVEWEDVLRAATALDRPVKLVLSEAKALADRYLPSREELSID